jgi:hypothetical protein
MLSYATGGSGSGADVEMVRTATELARQRRPDLAIDGPLQYDAAVDAGVARTKLPESSVAGRATVFIFPDLNTGNNTYKAVQRSAGAIMAGPVLRAAQAGQRPQPRLHGADIVNTVAITAISSGEDRSRRAFIARSISAHCSRSADWPSCKPDSSRLRPSSLSASIDLSPGGLSRQAPGRRVSDLHTTRADRPHGRETGTGTETGNQAA